MGTHALIGRLNADGTVTSIYLHWDGHPGRAGCTLLQHYSTPTRVAALLALGDLSQLHPSIDPPGATPHSYGQPAPGVCIAYGRDRGEPGTDAATLPEVAAWWAHAIGPDGMADYGYLYRPCGATCGGWYAQSCREPGVELPLACVDLEAISQ